MAGNGFKRDNNRGYLWKRTFFPIWGGQAFSLLSSSIVQFAIVWWITLETGSAAMLSIGTIMTILPESFLNPFIGAIVDKGNRKKVLIVSDMTTGFASLILAGLFLLNAICEWHVFIILFVRSVAGCFHHNAMITSTSLMVPEDKLLKIAGLNQTLRGMMMFVTPPLGAVLIRLSSFQSIMFLDVLGVIIAVIPLLYIKIPEKQAELNQISKEGLLKDVIEGFKYIKKWNGARGMLAVSTVVNFFLQPVFMLSAAYVTQVLGGDELKFGYVGAATGIGFMAGGVFLSITGGHKKRMVTSICGILGAGTAVLAVGIIPADLFLLILCCFFSAGFMMPVCMSPIQSLIQSSVPCSLQGRVFSIMSSFSTITAPVSMATAGIVFDLYSPRFWYTAGGFSVVATGFTALAVKAIRNIDKGPPSL